MPRYIDADIAKEVLSSHEDRKGYLIGDHEQIIDEEVPTADVVEVVRCKECKHSTEELVKPYCNLLDMNVDNRYFCADGERKNDGEIH